MLLECLRPHNAHESAVICLQQLAVPPDFSGLGEPCWTESGANPIFLVGVFRFCHAGNSCNSDQQEIELTSDSECHCYSLPVSLAYVRVYILPAIQYLDPTPQIRAFITLFYVS